LIGRAGRASARVDSEVIANKRNSVDSHGSPDVGPVLNIVANSRNDLVPSCGG